MSVAVGGWESREWTDGSGIYIRKRADGKFYVARDDSDTMLTPSLEWKVHGDGPNPVFDRLADAIAAVAGSRGGEELPVLGDNGYPTEAELRFIRDFDVAKKPMSALVEFIQDRWWPEPFEFEGRTLRLVTGGWSGNEEIIGALRENYIFWGLCWCMSRRGGLHVFDIKELPAAMPPVAEPSVLKVGTGCRYLRGVRCLAKDPVATGSVCPLANCDLYDCPDDRGTAIPLVPVKCLEQKIRPNGECPGLSECPCRDGDPSPQKGRCERCDQEVGLTIKQARAMRKDGVGLIHNADCVAGCQGFVALQGITEERKDGEKK